MSKKYFKTFMVLVLILFSQAYVASADGINQKWVKVSGHNFFVNDRLFKFIGANTVNMVFYDDWDLDIEQAIRSAKENNISVLRFYIDLGWGKDTDFDRLFNTAAKYGVYIILAFTDCCCSGDYPTLAKYFEVHAPFCDIANEQSIKAFKKLIKNIIERKNSINGKVYRDDPTILAWEIANELEYWRFSEDRVYGWITEIASYIKSLDKNHLVTIGINAKDIAPGKDASLSEMFNVPGLDFFSFHFYPSAEVVKSNQMKPQDQDLLRISAITKGLFSLGKPVIMSEFGFSGSTELNYEVRSNQDTAGLYNLALKEYMDAAFSSGASGVMFWGWGIPEEEKVPMWWSKEGHSIVDKAFCDFLKKYRIPR